MTVPMRYDEDGFPLITKDPAAIRTYSFDFAGFPGAPYLRDGETLAGVGWTVAGGDQSLAIGDGSTEVETLAGTVVPDAPSFTGTQASVTLYGGTVGLTYTVTCTFRTQGVLPVQADERSFRVTIEDR